MTNNLYAIVWWTTEPRMCCLIDIIPKHYQSSPGSRYLLKTYTKEDFNKYRKTYKLVSKNEFENLHGRIKYP